MKQDNPLYKQIIFWIWGVFIAGVLIVVVLFWLISTGKLGYLPPLDELQNPQNDYATEILSVDGKSLGRYYITQNRVCQ